MVALSPVSPSLTQATNFDRINAAIVEAAKVSAKQDAFDLTGLLTSVSQKALQTDLAALTTTVNGKASTASVTALQGVVAGKADQSALAALTTTVNGKASAASVTALQSTVASKADQTALTALTTTVNGKVAQGDFDTLAAAVSGKASATVVTALQATVAGKADQSAVTSLTTVVDGKVAQTDFDTLSTTVDGKASAATVTALTGTVATKASKSSVDALTGSVASLSSTVAGKASQSDLTALTQAVSQKATQAAVDALSALIATKIDATQLGGIKPVFRVAPASTMVQAKAAGDAAWTNLFDYAQLIGPAGLSPEIGIDSANGTLLRWRLGSGVWKPLFNLALLKGSDGVDGGLYSYTHPGEGPQYFTTDLTIREPRDYADLPASGISQSSEGKTFRFRAAGWALSKQIWPVELTEFYTYRVSYIRPTLPADPAGDAATAGVKCYDAGRSEIADLVVASWNAPAANVRQTASAIFSRTDYGVPGVTVLPSATRYVRPYFRVFGQDQQTDLEVLAWNAGGGQAAEEAEIFASIARGAALTAQAAAAQAQASAATGKITKSTLSDLQATSAPDGTPGEVLLDPGAGTYLRIAGAWVQQLAVSLAQLNEQGRITSGNMLNRTVLAVVAGNGGAATLENGVATLLTVPSGSTGVNSSLVSHCVVPREDIAQYVGKALLITEVYEATANFLADKPPSNLALAVRRVSGDAITTVNVNASSSNPVTTTQVGTRITRSISYTVTADDLSLGVVYQIASSGASGQAYTLRPILTAYALVTAGDPKPKSAADDLLTDRIRRQVRPGLVGSMLSNVLGGLAFLAANGVSPRQVAGIAQMGATIAAGGTGANTTIFPRVLIDRAISLALSGQWINLIVDVRTNVENNRSLTTRVQTISVTGASRLPAYIEVQKYAPRPGQRRIVLSFVAAGDEIEWRPTIVPASGATAQDDYFEVVDVAAEIGSAPLSAVTLAEQASLIRQRLASLSSPRTIGPVYKEREYATIYFAGAGATASGKPGWRIPANASGQQTYTQMRMTLDEQMRTLLTGKRLRFTETIQLSAGYARTIFTGAQAKTLAGATVGVALVDVVRTDLGNNKIAISYSFPITGTETVLLPFLRNDSATSGQEDSLEIIDCRTEVVAGADGAVDDLPRLNLYLLSLRAVQSALKAPATATSVTKGVGLSALPTAPTSQIHPNTAVTTLDSGGRVTSAADQGSAGANFSAPDGSGPLQITDRRGRKVWRFEGGSQNHLNMAAGFVADQRNVTVAFIGRLHKRGSPGAIWSQYSSQNTLASTMQVAGSLGVAPYVLGGDVSAYSAGPDASWIIAGSQLQIIIVSSRAAASGQTLCINNRMVDVAAMGSALTALAGGAIGRNAYPGASNPAYGSFDMYRMMWWPFGMDRDQISVLAAALMAEYGIPPVAHQVGLEVDSITNGVVHASGRTTSMILTDPDGPYALPPDWRVINMSQPGDKVSDGVARRDLASGLYASARIPGGRNVAFMHAGRNDFPSTDNASYQGSAPNTAARGDAIYAQLVAYFSQADTGILARGWEGIAALNIACAEPSDTARRQLVARLSDPAFLTDTQSDSGMLYDGKMNIADLAGWKAPGTGGGTIFDTAAKTPNTRWYTDTTHPTAQGSREIAGAIRYSPGFAFSVAA